MKLDLTARKKLPNKDFALPGQGEDGGKGSGSYPINDPGHARNALARSAGKPEAGKVKAAVKKKFPAIGLKGALQAKKLV